MRHNCESLEDDLRSKSAAAEIERTSAFQRGHAAASAEKDKEITSLQAEVARLKALVEARRQLFYKWAEKKNELQDEVEKLKSDLQAADIVVSRLNGGKALQDLMDANNAQIETIEKLQAEVDRLKREASNNLDLAERHMNEKHKAWRALRRIQDRRYKHRQTVTPDNTFEAFNRMNDEMLVIFAECDAALEEPRT
jgi:chromosome segregation ATPase